MIAKPLLVIARLVFGLLTLVAIVIEAVHLAHHGSLDAVNYLSYFTNLSNIFAALVFVCGAALVQKSRTGKTPTFDAFRGAAALYMAITGVVYATLLSGEDLGLLMPWVNIVLHVLMPIVVVADWLCEPPRSTFSFKKACTWLIFSAVFLVYSLIRGHIVHWYAYPFLNPNKAGGYRGVAAYCAAILVMFVIFSWLLIVLARKLKHQTHAHAAR